MRWWPSRVANGRASRDGGHGRPSRYGARTPPQCGVRASRRMRVRRFAIPRLFQLGRALREVRNPLYYQRFPRPLFRCRAGRPIAARRRRQNRLESRSAANLASARALEATLPRSLSGPRDLPSRSLPAKGPGGDLAFPCLANSWPSDYRDTGALAALKSRWPKAFGITGRPLLRNGGAIRDVVQQSLLPARGISAMEQPKRACRCVAQRRESQRFVPIRRCRRARIVRGQYQGYREENGVPPESDSESLSGALSRRTAREGPGVPLCGPIRGASVFPIDHDRDLRTS